MLLCFQQSPQCNSPEHAARSGAKQSKRCTSKVDPLSCFWLCRRQGRQDAGYACRESAITGWKVMSSTAQLQPQFLGYQRSMSEPLYANKRPVSAIKSSSLISQLFADTTVAGSLQLMV